MESNNASENYKFCNHHHELTDEHEIVNFGDGDFVANKKGIPLLRAMNELGLKTRTHHIDGEHNFVSIVLDNVLIEIKDVNEIHADRTTYNGKKELLIVWDSPK